MTRSMIAWVCITTITIAASISPGRARADETGAPEAPLPDPSAEPPMSVVPPAAAPPSTNTYYVDDPSRPALPYYEGRGIPDGYRLQSSPRFGLVGTGIAVTSTLWTVSVITAVALDEQESAEGDPNFDDMYWPMFIPIIGPFITIKTADSSGTGAAILALDGVAQAAGLGLIIAGIAAPKVEIIPQRKLDLSPKIEPGVVGLNVGGAF